MNRFTGVRCYFFGGSGTSAKATGITYRVQVVQCVPAICSQYMHRQVFCKNWVSNRFVTAHCAEHAARITCITVYDTGVTATRNSEAEGRKIVTIAHFKTHMRSQSRFIGILRKTATIRRVTVYVLRLDFRFAPFIVDTQHYPVHWNAKIRTAPTPLLIHISKSPHNHIAACNYLLYRLQYSKLNARPLSTNPIQMSKASFNTLKYFNLSPLISA